MCHDGFYDDNYHINYGSAEERTILKYCKKYLFSFEPNKKTKEINTAVLKENKKRKKYKILHKFENSNND